MRLPGRRSNRRRRYQPESPPAGRIAVVLDQGAAMIAGELGDATARASGMSTVNRPRDADGGQDGHQRAGGHDGEQEGAGPIGPRWVRVAAVEHGHERSPTVTRAQRNRR